MFLVFFIIKKREPEVPTLSHLAPKIRYPIESVEGTHAKLIIQVTSTKKSLKFTFQGTRLTSSAYFPPLNAARSTQRGM